MHSNALLVRLQVTHWSSLPVFGWKGDLSILGKQAGNRSGPSGLQRSIDMAVIRLAAATYLERFAAILGA
jgi:hypothetical protein